MLEPTSHRRITSIDDSPLITLQNTVWKKGITEQQQHFEAIINQK